MDQSKAVNCPKCRERMMLVDVFRHRSPSADEAAVEVYKCPRCERLAVDTPEVAA